MEIIEIERIEGMIAWVDPRAKPSSRTGISVSSIEHSIGRRFFDGNRSNRN